jgi:hypothetical protein
LEIWRRETSNHWKKHPSHIAIAHRAAVIAAGTQKAEWRRT